MQMPSRSLKHEIRNVRSYFLTTARAQQPSSVTISNGIVIHTITFRIYYSQSCGDETRIDSNLRNTWATWIQFPCFPGSCFNGGDGGVYEIFSKQRTNRVSIYRGAADRRRCVPIKLIVHRIFLQFFGPYRFVNVPAAWLLARHVSPRKFIILMRDRIARISVIESFFDRAWLIHRQFCRNAVRGEWKNRAIDVDMEQH